jgi:molybdenum cofactor cytidylyltransferase
MMNLAAIILCAGSSTRMGSPKGLLELHDVPLVLHHIRAFETFATPIIVVLGKDAKCFEEILPKHIQVVHNAYGATTPPLASIRIGLSCLKPTFSALITPVDTPPARPQTIQRLISAQGLAVPVNKNGHRGHPVLLDPPGITRVQTEDLEQGLRTLLKYGREVMVDQKDISVDFDTPDAWKAFLRSYEE